MKLSAIIITRNEADSIQRCLKSVSFADERIVIDSNSTDDTVAIAQRSGATVHTRSWTGYGDQKNFGRDRARGEWLLFIDADEIVTPALAHAILSTIHSTAVDFLWLRIVTVFWGKSLRHLYGHNPRLFRKSAGQWTTDAVHEQAQTLLGRRIRLHDTLSEVITEPLLHHSHPTIQSYLTRMHRYTTLDAKQMAKTHQHRSGNPVRPSFMLPWNLALKQFVKMFFYKKGFLDGSAGFMWCVLSAYYEYEMAQKYRRLTI